MKGKLAGLYAIADTGLLDTHRLPVAVAAALAGGAAAVQLRCKGDARQRLAAARTLRPLCSDHQVPLIINDDVEVALAVGADGVHLGSSDMALADARLALGDASLIGASCYADGPLARRMQQAGADYVAFGSVYPSPTKPTAVRATLALIRAERPELEISVVAIGGITPENTPALLSAGVDAIAVISSLFGATDIRRQAQRFARCFQPKRGNT
ncbi:MAG: thiamine phosphate synthase [Gammaproteobacteria bacterium]|nr:thiamine phosphate synthase [Gammaproteobacteria bacterium]